MFAVMKELVRQKYPRALYPEHPRATRRRPRAARLQALLPRRRRATPASSTTWPTRRPCCRPRSRAEPIVPVLRAAAAFVLCTSAAAAAPPAHPLRVSADGRHLVQADGRPFFYLADTAWSLFHRLTREEADLYLRNRAAKGFTVDPGRRPLGERRPAHAERLRRAAARRERPAPAERGVLRPRRLGRRPGGRARASPSPSSPPGATSGTAGRTSPARRSSTTRPPPATSPASSVAATARARSSSSSAATGTSRRRRTSRSRGPSRRG